MADEMQKVRIVTDQVSDIHEVETLSNGADLERSRMKQIIRRSAQGKEITLDNLLNNQGLFKVGDQITIYRLAERDVERSTPTITKLTVTNLTDSANLFYASGVYNASFRGGFENKAIYTNLRDGSISIAGVDVPGLGFRDVQAKGYKNDYLIFHEANSEQEIDPAVDNILDSTKTSFVTTEEIEE